MDWVQDGERHHYHDPGPGAEPVSSRPPGTELEVRVELSGLVFYALAREWTAERVFISWHDDTYAYRTAWVPSSAVQAVQHGEYRAAEAARFQRAARLPAPR